MTTDPKPAKAPSDDVPLDRARGKAVLDRGPAPKPSSKQEQEPANEPVLDDEDDGRAGPLEAAAAALRPRSWVPRVAGIACYLIGLLDVLSGLLPRFRSSPLDHVAHYVPGSVASAANAATVIVGVLLILLAHALKRRKRRAWRIVVALLVADIVFHALHSRHVPGMALSAILLAVLLVHSREFYALGDPRSRWRAAGAFVTLLAITTGLGLIMLSVRPHALVGSPGVLDKLQQIAYGLVGISGPIKFHSDRISDLTYFTLLGMGIVTALITAYLALRPEEPVARLAPGQEEQVRKLLVKQGRRDSLGYFALRRDKSVVFSPSEKAVIAYRVVSGVMLASGDPVGDPEAWPGAIKRFVEEADRHAWIPAVMGCSEQGGEIWCREAGLDAVELGDEAIVEVADFSLDGRPMRNVRQMVNRVERQGYKCEVRRVRDLSREQIRSIRRQAASWRGTTTERGFSMALGRFGDPADGDCVVVTAEKDGEVRAVLNFVPWGADGLSLDLMRRDRTADPGLNELLIVAALREAPHLGVKRVSLNFAVFRSALERGEKLGAGPILRAWRGLLVFLSRWFQIESLYRFNAKFRPVWEPRFVVFRQTRDLPRIALAALEAEAFLVLPSLGKLFGRGGCPDPEGETG